ncbi:MAG: hypothetical protein R3C49_21180 [Planctomycetaceae bacterium]
MLIKAFAMDERRREKDAYDVYFVVSQYPGGPQQLGTQIAAMLPNRLVEDAVRVLQKKFATLNSIGSVDVAVILEQQGNDAGLSRQMAFQYLRAMLQVIR